MKIIKKLEQESDQGCEFFREIQLQGKPLAECQLALSIEDHRMYYTPNSTAFDAVLVRFASANSGPGDIWEFLGTILGFVVSLILTNQIVCDIMNPEPSTLSVVSQIGWVIVCSFWFLYGLKFNRFAVWSSNLLAAICQFILLILVLLGF